MPKKKNLWNLIRLVLNFKSRIHETVTVTIFVLVALWFRIFGLFCLYRNHNLCGHKESSGSRTLELYWKMNEIRMSDGILNWISSVPFIVCTFFCVCFWPISGEHRKTGHKMLSCFGGARNLNPLLPPGQEGRSRRFWLLLHVKICQANENILRAVGGWSPWFVFLGPIAAMS